MCYESQGIESENTRDAVAGDRLVISKVGDTCVPVSPDIPDVCVCMKNGTVVELANNVRATFHQRERRGKNAGRTPSDTFWIDDNWEKAFFMHQLAVGTTLEVVSIPGGAAKTESATALAA